MIMTVVMIVLQFLSVNRSCVSETVTTLAKSSFT